MLTMSDIVDIMRVFYVPGTTGASVASALNELTIDVWRSYAAQLAAGGVAHFSSPDVRRFVDDARRAAAVAAADEAMGGVAPPAPPTPARVRPRLVAIDPEDDLLSVSRKLRRHCIHHMPVIDVEQNAVVAVLNHRMWVRRARVCRGPNAGAPR